MSCFRECRLQILRRSERCRSLLHADGSCGVAGLVCHVRWLGGLCFDLLQKGIGGKDGCLQCCDDVGREGAELFSVDLGAIK